jgi:phosphoenolpyruvate carboxykinase (ATP)
MQCYVLSTGRVGGNQGANITPEVTFACVEGILRNSIRWRYDDILGYEIPESLPLSNWKDYDPYTYWSREEYGHIIGALRKERKEYLQGFRGLATEIVLAV